MSKATGYFCDRCHKNIMRPASMVTFSKEIVGERCYTTNHVNVYTFDLCPKCLEELEHFLNREGDCKFATHISSMDVCNPYDTNGAR